MRAFVNRVTHQFVRRPADAIIDNLNPDITGLNRNLFRPVGMPIQSRLPNQHLHAFTQLLGNLVNACAQRLNIVRIPGDDHGCNARRRPVFAKHLAQGFGPFAGGHTGMRTGNRTFHDIAAFARGLFQPRERFFHRGLIPIGSPGFQFFNLFLLGHVIDGHDRFFARR